MVKYKEFIQRDINSILLDNLKILFDRIYPELNKRFNDGYATCTYATYHVSFFFEYDKGYYKKLGYRFEIIDGEYNGMGHWFLKLYHIKSKKEFIIDFGNNLTHKALKSGIIEPIIFSKKDSEFYKYSVDSILSFPEYKKYYQEIKHF